MYILYFRHALNLHHIVYTTSEDIPRFGWGPGLDTAGRKKAWTPLTNVESRPKHMFLQWLVNSYVTCTVSLSPAS